MADKSSWRERLFNWGATGERSHNPWDSWGWMNYGGHLYPLGMTTLGNQKQEVPPASFDGYVNAIYRSNAIVFACMETRRLIFSEARFQYRRLRDGRPGELFGKGDLSILENPWPNGTTGDLLSRAIQDVDLAGNFYATRQGDRLLRMRPDWVSIVLGSRLEPDDPGIALDAEVVGYVYQPGGYASLFEPVALLPEQVAHWAPTTDPLARFRGMSWLTPVIQEIMADSATTAHKLAYFEHGATVNLALSYPEGMTSELFQQYVDLFKQGHEGVANAYRTLHIGGGATPTPVGSDMQQIDFKVTQGAGETRIAAAARVPPIMVGLSEGLAAATYSNYGQARRAFADLTIRPLWRDLAGSLSSIVAVPSDAQLWYDDRDIPFLQEDVKDEADIQQTQANALKSLLDAGFTPESSVAAIVSDDMSLLDHSGLFSVQLQPPGTQAPDPETSGNGAVPIGAVA